MDKKVIYPELSYKIVGILYSVFNNLGYGYQEKYYQRALIKAFTNEHLNFKSQLYAKLKYKDENIGFYLADFLIENKIILEIKVGDHFSQQYITQTFAYLKATKLKLAILAHFTNKGIIFKRILNLY
ncbi:MAG TPA: GxxExxY protein [bacterium]|mgnify:CR=1 FL=1|nr:GxxExxY protein [bacterium]HPL95342.1 GxxExxY protein [bacterium]